MLCSFPIHTNNHSKLQSRNLTLPVYGRLVAVVHTTIFSWLQSNAFSVTPHLHWTHLDPNNLQPAFNQWCLTMHYFPTAVLLLFRWLCFIQLHQYCTTADGLTTRLSPRGTSFAYQYSSLDFSFTYISCTLFFAAVETSNSFFEFVSASSFSGDSCSSLPCFSR